MGQDVSQLRSNNVVAAIGTALFGANDWRLQPVNYRPVPLWMPEETRWPRSAIRSAGLTVAEAPLNAAPMVWDWDQYLYSAPLVGQRRNIVTGVTYDSVGTILGSAVVKLYETASDAVMDTGVTSDPTTGVYVATSPTNTACYAVAYKTGSPDVEGTTANTLTPA